MRKCKTISFDLNDCFERDLLAYVEGQSKFSKYIKRLIQRDKEGLQTPIKEIDNEPDDAIESYF